MARTTSSTDQPVEENPESVEETPAEETTTDTPLGARVKYVGTADIKQLENLEWSSQNDFTIPASEMDESLLEYLRSQPDFYVIND